MSKVDIVKGLTACASDIRSEAKVSTPYETQIINVDDFSTLFGSDLGDFFDVDQD